MDLGDLGRRAVYFQGSEEKPEGPFILRGASKTFFQS